MGLSTPLGDLDEPLPLVIREPSVVVPAAVCKWLRDPLLLERRRVASQAGRIRPDVNAVIDKIDYLGRWWLANQKTDPAAGAPDEGLLSVAQAAEILGVSRQAVRKRAGRSIPATKYGQEWRFRRSDVLATLERSP